MENPLAQDLDHILDHTRELWREIRGLRLFLTGGTGFVGTWLAESLLWANRRIDAGVSAILLTRRPEAFRQRFPHLALDPAITLLRGDASGFEAPAGDFPLVIHAATERAFPPDRERPTGIFNSNVEATRQALEFARNRRAARMLFTSSGAVYGKQPPDLERVAEDYPGAPSPVDTDAVYGHSKRASEFLCASYARVYGVHVSIARLFAFTGPNLPLNENFAAGNFLRDILRGGPVRISGDGSPYRSYLYAADMAIWIWTILLRGAAAYPYNVGSPDAVSIRELAERMVAVTAPEMEIQIAGTPAPGVLPSRYVPSTERAERELGLRPRIDLEEGVRRSHRWHLARAAQPPA